MSKKAEYTPKEQQKVIREAFAKYYAYLRDDDPIGAYQVIFSLLETRINGMYLEERKFRLQHGFEKTANLDVHRPLKKKINYLEQHQRLRPDEAAEIRQCVDERNGSYHDLIWRMREVTIEKCEKVRALEMKAMNARKRQKYRHQRGIRPER